MSVMLSIGKTVLTCEICGKRPAKEGPWILCADCNQLYKTLFQFLKQHNEDPRNLKLLKEVLQAEARQIGLTA